MFKLRKFFSKKYPWIYYTSQGGMGVDTSHPVVRKRMMDTIEQFEELQKAYQLTGNPMVGKKEYLLNDVLNKALIGKNRIKGIPNSNTISEFVTNYLKEN